MAGRLALGKELERLGWKAAEGPQRVLGFLDPVRVRVGRMLTAGAVDLADRHSWTFS